ncbi:HdeD family acid-resistance protein [Nocardia goodfellowii]
MPENVGVGRVDPRVPGGRQAVLASGVVTVILGVVIAVWPDKTLAVAELLFASYLLINGALQLWIALAAKFAVALRALVLVSAAISALLAVLCLNGGNSVLLLAMWLGIGWSVRGITQATVAVWDDRLPNVRRHELLGLFTLVLGIAMLALPFEALESLALVGGGGLIVLGILELLIAGVGAVVGLPGPARVPATRGG